MHIEGTGDPVERDLPGDGHPRGNTDNKRSFSSFNEEKKRLFKSVKCGFARCVFRSFLFRSFLPHPVDR